MNASRTQRRVGRQSGGYLWFSAGLCAIVGGFWRTFYGDPFGNDAWHTLHGIASTLWVLLLIAQSLLIGRHNRRLHETLGWSSVALVAFLLGQRADLRRRGAIGRGADLSTAATASTRAHRTWAAARR